MMPNRLSNEVETTRAVPGRLAKVPEGPDLEVLVREINRLRAAGTNLCLAAIHVGTEYDGIHRLLRAAAEWLDTLASDFGRAKHAGLPPKNPAECGCGHMSGSHYGPHGECTGYECRCTGWVPSKARQATGEDQRG